MEEQNTEEGLSAEALAEAGKGGGMGGKIIGLVVVVLVIALGVYALTRGSEEGNKITPQAASTEKDEAAEVPTNTEATAPVPAEGTTTPETEVVVTGQTVTFSDAGYSPPSVTVKKGDSVMFKNESATATWPASATHPTHTVYPGSDIAKCGTSEQAGIFDACVGLKTGEAFTFQFNNVGKWNYHDHLNPTKFGSVTVTE